MIQKNIFFSLLLFLLAFQVFGQKTERVELVQADSLEGGVYKGVEINKLMGNVIFKQQNTYLYADSVYQYKDKNSLEAFGNVRINQADTLTITGERASYDGDKRQARITGNVVMQDPRMTLTTPSLDYNLNKRQAVYTEGGTIVDPENRLESQRGTYDAATKMFTFQGNVKLFTQNYEITSETLRYNTLTKIAYFQGPTYIKGETGNLYAESGEYNTLKKISKFGRNAYIETESYRLSGDNLYYDEATLYGQATGNVRMLAKQDDVVITGGIARYWQNQGKALIYQNPVMRSISDGDTLYVSADTLLSVEQKDTLKPDMLYAFHDVKIFKSDLQGSCDSLIYNKTDSIIFLRQAPILWSEGSQLVADSILIKLRDKRIDRMEMYNNAFMVSEDTLNNYNQIKGRDMVALFSESKLRRLDVNGNGESIYFALEGDTAVTGMNKAICSDMILQFDNNKIQSISFLVNPDASFIPPHELNETDKRLEGFTWRIEEKPSLEDILSPRRPKQTAPVAKPAPEAPKKSSKTKEPKKKTTSKKQAR
ncbi:MAG: LPS export ABC transporter periplasmic protein LptC [Hymenobacteraceae bacterium]|nr:LPS export ABC transporter periplasmic protein LptC [Hymenobacteraceae bacterium]MDX5395517.1 LPS export ABC transporter periplasmic protein LptC [Hymenobacteraceae bacterium]MDX5443376.1 LPS export ABC transporter periplasmic protein LptC [Hymenobacteraceae bacterium]MDX5511571.1 LPS export ABC transporter periplasmic protein LptC [Hymenobacteraceae bacterium]